MQFLPEMEQEEPWTCQRDPHPGQRLSKSGRMTKLCPGHKFLSLMHGSGESWIIHSQNSYTTIHIAAQENENDLLVDAKTRSCSSTMVWLKYPTKEPFYKDKWMTSNFFDKPDNWHQEQEIRYAWCL
jgi:hypothetical protein